MTEVIVKKTEALSGVVTVPPSKAYTHRMLIAALLSHGDSKIKNYLISDDTLATLHAIKVFGAKVKQNKAVWKISGIKQLKTPKQPVNCRESGSTLRFMIPVAALAKEGETTFVMGPSLSRRPLAPLLQSLKQLGVKTNHKSGEPSLKVKGGGIGGGLVTIRGDVSSQFVSGLLLACPMARKDTKITLTTPMESRNYVQMTIEILKKHNVEVFISEDFMQLEVPSNQRYVPCNHVVQGDFSSAAFLLAAAAITSSKIRVKNLNYNTKQGDKAILDILKNAGINIHIGDGLVEVEGALCNGIDVDARDVPDLVPACAVIACYTKGVSRIYNVKRLRFKESDRLAAIYTELKKMGADITINGDGLIIRPSKMRGAIIDPHNDHRIAMACAVAALGAEGETKISNAECVRKSYPTFFRDLKLLGGKIRGGELLW